MSFKSKIQEIQIQMNASAWERCYQTLPLHLDSVFSMISSLLIPSLLMASRWPPVAPSWLSATVERQLLHSSNFPPLSFVPIWLNFSQPSLLYLPLSLGSGRFRLLWGGVRSDLQHGMKWEWKKKVSQREKCHSSKGYEQEERAGPEFMASSHMKDK